MHDPGADFWQTLVSQVNLDFPFFLVCKRTDCRRAWRDDCSAVPQHPEIEMLSQIEKECLLACNECATACLECAVACLKEDDPKSMVRCIKLDMGCADICRLAGASIARGDDHLKEVCSLCAQVCQTCATECAQHPMKHCQVCAEACQRCSDACTRMAR
jgi:hypothetical protein